MVILEYHREKEECVLDKNGKKRMAQIMWSKQAVQESPDQVLEKCMQPLKVPQDFGLVTGSLFTGGRDYLQMPQWAVLTIFCCKVGFFPDKIFYIDF